LSARRTGTATTPRPPEDLVNLLTNANRYRVQMWARSEPRWGSDNQTFTDWFEAYRYALQLAETWNLIEEVRVVPELDEQLREQWYELGIENPWISSADDPAVHP